MGLRDQAVEAGAKEEHVDLVMKSPQACILIAAIAQVGTEVRSRHHLLQRDGIVEGASLKVALDGDGVLKCGGVILGQADHMRVGAAGAQHLGKIL
jgi:hypothetical protein